MSRCTPICFAICFQSMGWKASLILIIFSLWVSGISSAAEVGWNEGIKVTVIETAVPLTPALSSVQISVPGSRFFDQGFPTRLDARIWYLANSAILFPNTFVEAGIGVDWIVISKGTILFEAGLGTALAFQTRLRSVSIPLIVNFLSRYTPVRWFCLETSLDLMIYGRGAGVLGQVVGLFRPFSKGLVLGTGVGYGVIAEWDLNPFGHSLQLSISAGYLF